MISGAISLCEKSTLYEEVFEADRHYVSFEKDLSNFDEKLKFALSDSKEIEKIKQNAYNYVSSNHTYNKRALDMIDWLYKIKK